MVKFEFLNEDKVIGFTEDKKYPEVRSDSTKHYIGSFDITYLNELLESVNNHSGAKKLKIYVEKDKNGILSLMPCVADGWCLSPIHDEED